LPVSPSPSGMADPIPTDMAALLADLHEVRQRKDADIQHQHYEEAARLRDREVNLQTEINRLEAADAEPPAPAATIRIRVWTAEPTDFEVRVREAFALGLALSAESQNLLSRATAEAVRRGHKAVSPHHLFAVLLQPDGALTRELRSRGVDLTLIVQALHTILNSQGEPGGQQEA
jgi:hypothetical protein